MIHNEWKIEQKKHCCVFYPKYQTNEWMNECNSEKKEAWTFTTMNNDDDDVLLLILDDDNEKISKQQQ